jgi:NADPH:quinone reductase-like Zn-dependent oxidoreductase/NADP-dependent 3-hydroxy acid dehydrogenase YdfG/acyl carrier protein
VTIAPDSSVLSIYHEQADTDPILCVRAKVFSFGRIPPPVDLEALEKRLPNQVSSKRLYANLAKQGLHHGPRFRSVTSLHCAEGEVLAELALPDGVDAEGYHLHPVLLDGAFQSLTASVDQHPSQDLIPVGIDRIHFFGGSSRVAYSHGRVRQTGADGITSDLTLFAADGTVIAEVSGFRCRFLPRPEERDALHQSLYTRTWIPLRDKLSAATAPWVCVENGDENAVLHRLSQHNVPVSLVDLRWAARCENMPHPVEHGAQMAEQLLRTVNALPPGRVARIFLITTCAETLDGDDHGPAVDTAALLGLARTVMSERPDLRLTTVDLDVPLADSELFGVLGRIDDEQEVALRDGQLFCVRLNRVSLVESVAPQQHSTIPVTPGSAFTLELASIGALDDLAFVPCARSAPGPEDVEIAVEFVPLGFKDVLKAMGFISERITRGTVTGSGIGMEVVGRISGVGSDVTSLQVGDRVYAVLGGAFRSHAVLPWRHVVPLPASISLEASTGLVTICTAYYGLTKIAQLKAGEVVLIHGATGGVGLAAIAIARWLGAEVIATAGSDEKRNHLRTLGIERVTTSREVSFADDVMNWTAGRGVDVVLNFSPGELMTKSVSCLAPFGRFIEVGKMSFEEDTALALRPFNENLTYASVDFDRLLASRRDYASQLYAEVLALMVDGKIDAIPVTMFPASRISEAFRLMARSKHMGKVCVAIADPALTLRTPPPPRIRCDATYLVTGGLGGFGLETAAWLAEQGARHLALVSRRGAASPEAGEAIERLTRHGVDVRVFAADVGQRKQIADVLDEISATMPPLRGVIHSAAVLDDRRITELDRASLNRVLGPKALGAWHLHTLTSDLDFFVMYSSISSLIGNPGQGNYVAANAVLDALAAHRRHHGLAASVIQWGALGETGLVARDANVARHLEQLGLTALCTDNALRALGEVIDRGLESVAVVEADWARLASSAASGSGQRRLQLLVQAKSVTAQAAQAAALFDGLSDEARWERVQSTLARIVADVMGMKEPTFALSQPLRDAGMDSIMGLEIATAIERSLGLRVSAVELSSGPSIEQLAGMVLRRMDRPATD